eukprot:5918847-Ditylum_brightwellii.AAC.1
MAWKKGFGRSKTRSKQRANACRVATPYIPLIVEFISRISRKEEHASSQHHPSLHMLFVALILLTSTTQTMHLADADVVASHHGDTVSTIENKNELRGLVRQLSDSTIGDKLDCLCASYDPTATRKIDKDNDEFCKNGFQALLDAYAPAGLDSGLGDEEVGSDSTCSQKLGIIPQDYCGYAEVEEPFGNNITPEICSHGSNRNTCAFHTYPVERNCHWVQQGLHCKWTGTTCWDGGISLWYQRAYGITDMDMIACAKKMNEADCKATVIIDKHCRHDLLVPDGYDKNSTDCASITDEITCMGQSYIGTEVCVWHEKELGRTTTYEICCESPYVTPYSGSKWCEDAGMDRGVTLRYVDDGRISSGVPSEDTSNNNNLTCDEIAGTYVYMFRSREVFNDPNNPYFELVPTVDANCCIGEVVTNGPSQFHYSSSSPSGVPSMVVSFPPSTETSTIPILQLSNTPVFQFDHFSSSDTDTNSTLAIVPSAAPTNEMNKNVRTNKSEIPFSYPTTSPSKQLNSISSESTPPTSNFDSFQEITTSEAENDLVFLAFAPLALGAGLGVHWWRERSLRNKKAKKEKEEKNTLNPEDFQHVM